MSRGVWSPDEDAQLYALRAKGWTFARIGDQLGRSSDSCRVRYHDLWPKRAAPGMAPRLCLACRKPFAPPGRYIFRCVTCRSQSAGLCA